MASNLGDYCTRAITRAVAQIGARGQVDIERVCGGALVACPLGNLFELSQVGWRAKETRHQLATS